jgi:hypothetical protein
MPLRGATLTQEKLLGERFYGVGIANELLGDLRDRGERRWTNQRDDSFPPSR